MNEQQPSRAAIRYVALGDSFTEGVGDEQPDGSVRGWADLVAQGLADAAGEPIQYANLAIRGRLLGPIIAEQLDPAITLDPTVATFNGGGNDMLRPGTNLEEIASATRAALGRLRDAGIDTVALAGPNPTGGLPGGGRVQEKGDALVEALEGIVDRLGIRFTDNWSDREISKPQYWSRDRLHLNPTGHRRVATNVLRTLDIEPPSDWVLDAAPIPRPTTREQLSYARQHVIPWIGRRLTGRSSGDGRSAKFADWVWVEPSAR